MDNNGNQRKRPLAVVAFILLLVVVFAVSAVATTAVKRRTTGIAEAPVEDSAEGGAESETDGAESGSSQTSLQQEPVKVPEAVTALLRPSLFQEQVTVLYDENLVPSVPAYQVSADLSELINAEDVLYGDDFQKKLARNGFVVMGDYGSNEFFGKYESNRYGFIPSFVTVDSMMHTYHLYFAYLQKNTERVYLSKRLETITDAMLAESGAQYEALKGSAWESAALRNVTFFAVAKRLLDPGADLPAECKGKAEEELALIADAAQMTASPLFSDTEPAFEDYTQYKPRGYYDGDETLERYFRTMMWYGRMTMLQNREDHMRSALLMTLAMDADKAAMEAWESVYAVTSFFAGESDDAGYCEFRPLTEAAYGAAPAIKDLPAKTAAWDAYYALTKDIEAPEIVSVPIENVEEDTDTEEETKGFRFMGQRFTFDAAVFQQLLYNHVGENKEGKKRMLPDALDMPAAFGSETAYDLLKEQGETEYKNYESRMETVRDGLEKAPEALWTASLYAGWLKTLLPLLEEKGEGYPMFMQNREWAKKNVECFLSSWTELKHDTVLYGKQSMAEMGGGPIAEQDDRGYVEPEPVVFGRLASLTAQTRDGLKKFDMLDAGAEESLNRLYDLSYSLMVIAEKELKNEVLTGDEYELIKIFGGELEHFWHDVWKDEAENEYFDTNDFPAPLVTDVATDAESGRVLQVATGKVQEIWVIVPVDGTLRAARGCVYSFHQFAYPADKRMTDKDWYVELGILPAEGEEWPSGYGDVSAYMPEWAKSYRYYYVR